MMEIDISVLVRLELTHVRKVVLYMLELIAHIKSLRHRSRRVDESGMSLCFILL